ncbi:MAG: cytochrome ubiquinol oxidase subunit I [Acidobacteria bacterium]|nr:cytochrome ubiquinol oxidase subunit I [Acidobacteriota bacterium]
MDYALALHRFQFAFTISYHYLFPQLTMGLALLIVVLKTLHLRNGDVRYAQAARFWAKIFGINFAFGVVTGIPMEFQFGTNWSRFSKAAGGVIGQTLALEGVYSFFLESTFLGLFLFGEKKLGRLGHWFAAFMVFLGSWLSGFFIIATDAWMQHPVGYTTLPDGSIQLESLSALLLNPWTFWMYLHNMTGAVVTGSFAMVAAGAYYLIAGKHGEQGKVFLRIGVPVATIAAVAMIFPTGDGQGKNLAKYQPITLAAAEGLFDSEAGAPIAILGQPDAHRKKLDNPLLIPRMLSFITYQRWDAEVKGLNHFPQDQWPDQIELLYYSFHIMVGLGTIFVGLTVLSSLFLWKGKLFGTRWLLWILMLALPFPFIANTAGWFAAELGRQPWLVYGVMKTSAGYSARVSAGNTLFTTLGFLGMYGLLSILYLLLMHRELEHGPGSDGSEEGAH